MKKAVVTALVLALAIGASGCGEKKDENVTIIGGADGPTSIYLAPSSDKDEVLSGTWQTASIGYEADGDMQPEYYVQFEGLQINYGHMKDGDFIVDHTDDISYLDEIEPGKYIVQAESSTGVQYTLKTADSDNDVLEYYETWNEDEFPDAYRGGASLTRCN
ncbi:hypothetical protein [Butyrivibrio sp. INlla16]|uniref:hypothetical protein n=1 Tax=Butyrivibrio sp. INlla16 TaxID=1520807 RepID=UPI00088C65C5|nr:hypothetical protein [Butyrivibrio sp. INlla16]SDB52364.1 hypothetical protein SAMN02910263_02654 [Butyrivibrio sp. INlla16]